MSERASKEPKVYLNDIFEINIEIIWDIVKNKIPNLKTSVKKIKKGLV
ncbi:MAG: hypothetical protein HZB65_04440 [Candidatus Aenigmarchaeota archaeon]|nr:hypothetical protein [Candidatus Aenigmarchaeota archaeon]